jgi:hypothetical protein
MPFYRRLTAVRAGDSGSSRIIAVGPETVEAIKGYFRQHGVPLEAAVTLQPGHASRLKVSGTPTLILVDRNGSVLGVWIGKLKPEAESAVLSAVTGSMSTVGASE